MNRKTLYKIGKAIALNMEKASYYARLAYNGNGNGESGINNGFRSWWEQGHLEKARAALHTAALLREYIKGRTESIPCMY